MTVEYESGAGKNGNWKMLIAWSKKTITRETVRGWKAADKMLGGDSLIDVGAEDMRLRNAGTIGQTRGRE